MVSKRQKIIAIVVVVLIVITGFVYLTLPPVETVADAMILSPKEIGPVWRGAAEYYPFS